MFCDFNSPKLSCILKDEKAAETNLTSLKLPMVRDGNIITETLPHGTKGRIAENIG